MVAARGTRARSDHHRKSAEERRQGRHEKRPKALASSGTSGVRDGVALVLALVLRKLDDQDRVLRGKSYEKDESELRVYRQRIRRAGHPDAEPLESAQRAEHGDEDREHHGERNRPRLVLRDEEEVAEQDRERDERRRAALVARLLERQGRPVVAVVVREDVLEHLPQVVHDLA